MSVEEKTQKDDPQIHLMAAKYCEKFRLIRDTSENEAKFKVLISCIRFFAHYIKYLPECCNDVLNICQCYMGLLKDESIAFDVSVVNRVVGICTAMMIRRKEENIVRSTCGVLMETLKMIPPASLKLIVTKYSKSLTLIFQKIYLVQTYFTQLLILEIFIFITKDLKKLLGETISKHQLMHSATEEVVKLVIDKINKIDLDDYEKSARKFLRFFNNNLFPKTCILSIEGRMTKINSHPIKQKENMLVNFNGRNLTVSFYIHNKLFLANNAEKKSQKEIDNELVFIEFECESIDASSKVYKGKHYVDVNIDVNQAVTYNEERTRINLDEIKKISLRLIDEESTLKKFMDSYYEKYKQNERMMNDNTSGIDKMSIMTFQTSASLLDDLKNLNEAKTQENQDIKIQNNVIAKRESVEKIKSIQVKPRAENATNFEDLMVKKENTAPQKALVRKESAVTLNSAKTRPKRQSAKKANEKMNDIYDEDNMADDGKFTTSYREFKTQQKKKNSAADESQDSNRNYYLEPVEIITRTTLRSKTTKFNKYETKPKHYDTEEENREVKRKGRQPKKESKKQVRKVQQPKIETSKDQLKVKEQEERKPLTNFDLIKNVTKENADIKEPLKIQKPNQQAQKRKFPEDPVLNESVSDRLIIDDHMEIEPPIIEMNQPIKKRKMDNETRAESVFSGRSPTPESFKKIVAQKRAKEAGVNNSKVQNGKRRRLTAENIFEFSGSDKEVPVTAQATSKVEEWLKSTSDSFSLDLSDVRIEPDIPINQNSNRVDAAAKVNVAQNEDADNESEISFGQFANDEHQNYSSSSHESSDLDAKKETVPKQKKVTATVENAPNLTQNRGFEYPLQNNFVSQNNVMDPSKVFETRCRDVAVKLALRKKKIDENEKEMFKKHDREISIYGNKCLEQVQKTKAQLKLVNQLHHRYETEKSKLMDDLTEQEKMFQKLKREIGKRTEAVEMHNQIKKKELMNLKKEALRKNEELMHDVWREYVDNFQSCFNNSIKKAYEI